MRPAAVTGRDEPTSGATGRDRDTGGTSVDVSGTSAGPRDTAGDRNTDGRALAGAMGVPGAATE
ncbi:hypothetical protein ACM9HD_33865, partial [Streptomyces sp. JAC25]|uniref:hypothetical protein n=1 Tax=Streptomyces sp. JAC25 TaxID=3418413 RepID=UPI003D816F37